jgi:hypothetical protein
VGYEKYVEQVIVEELEKAMVIPPLASVNMASDNLEFLTVLRTGNILKHVRKFILLIEKSIEQVLYRESPQQPYSLLQGYQQTAFVKAFAKHGKLT